MSNMDSGLKDKIIGKAKEVEGKLTGDKLREVEGKAQKTKGKVKAKVKKGKRWYRARPSNRLRLLIGLSLKKLI